MDQRPRSELLTDDVQIAGLTVRFIGGEATDDALHAVHRCIQRTRLAGPLTVIVRWAEPGITVRSLRLVCADGEEICASGPALLPALHKLCEHATSLQFASQQDRLRWRQAMARNSSSSGVFSAV